MFSMMCRSIQKVDRELARAVVVVQLEVEMRTGRIRIQRTFLS